MIFPNISQNRLIAIAWHARLVSTRESSMTRCLAFPAYSSFYMSYPNIQITFELTGLQIPMKYILL